MSKTEEIRRAEQRVTPLELFFDLVFVLSFTQVTTTMAHDPTWKGLGEGVLILAAVWWAWAAYGWLTNTINASLYPFSWSVGSGLSHPVDHRNFPNDSPCLAIQASFFQTKRPFRGQTASDIPV